MAVFNAPTTNMSRQRPFNALVCLNKSKQLNKKIAPMLARNVVNNIEPNSGTPTRININDAPQMLASNISSTID
jgi:hypothetical protein